MIIQQSYIHLSRPRDTGEGKDCLWYGTTFCDGDLIEVRAEYDICKNLKAAPFKDLKRWWYHMRCSGGVMRVVSRAWADVARQTRRP